MVAVRSWLSRERPGMPVDRIFDAACDLMLAARDLEQEAGAGTQVPAGLPATLGVLEAALRSLDHTVDALGARVPRTPDDRELRRSLTFLSGALRDAANVCDEARSTVSDALDRRPG